MKATTQPKRKSSIGSDAGSSDTDWSEKTMITKSETTAT